MDDVVARLQAELGAEHVALPGPGLEEYFDPFPLEDPGRYAPGLAVRPADVEQVQAVLRIATEARTPVWTVSQGRNNGYGGRSPRVSGSIVLDLSRMNRVLDIDSVSGTVLLEPGVRFFDLYEALRSAGSPFWPSVPDLGWGSVVGNALDRGLGYTAYGEHWNSICGMEVVLADGDVVRTGMGAMSASRSWQLYKPGFGPSLDGIFGQSNLGVVTKMGLWLMPRPERWAAVDVSMPEAEDLGALIDVCRPLKLSGTIQTVVSTADVLGIASFIGPRSDWYTGEGPIPESVELDIKERFGLGRWNQQFGLYGSARELAARLADVRDAYGALEGARFTVAEYDGDIAPEDVPEQHRTRAGIPGMYVERMPYWHGGRGGHVAIGPVAPITSEDALRMRRIIRRRFEEHGVDYFAVFIAYHRHMLHLAQIMFDRDDAELSRRSRELARVLVQDLAAEGYGEYRTHVYLMDAVADSFDWNDHALRRLDERIKDALDPAGILSPGKQGVWPAAFRDRAERPENEANEANEANGAQQ